MVRAWVIALLVGFVGPLAAEAQPLSVPELPQAKAETPFEDGTLGADLDRDPACIERTNGCEVCARGDDGKPKCSLPGIACQPDGWRCTVGAPGSREKLHPGR